MYKSTETCQLRSRNACRICLRGFTVLCASVLALLAGTRVRQEGATPPYVVGRLFYTNGKISIAGQIFDFGASIGGEGFCILDIGGRYRRFEAWVGLPDDRWRVREGRYSVQVDGRTVASGTVNPGDKARPLDIDLAGAASMRIELSGAVLAVPKWIGTDVPEAKAPVTVSPSDGMAVRKGTVTFVWKPVDGAHAYGIEIVATALKSPSQSGQPRIWSFTTDAEPTYRVDFSEFPPGEYRWSVIAFDDAKTLGPFSRSSQILVEE